MKSDYDKIWEAAMRKLTIRSMSYFELRQKLQMKFQENKGTILKVLDEMKRVELINDKKFTEQFVEHLIQKPIGRMKIMLETRKKGLDPEEVESALMSQNWSEEESAKEALSQKQKTLSETDERKRKQKCINFLRSRGFRDSVIYKAMR